MTDFRSAAPLIDRAVTILHDHPGIKRVVSPDRSRRQRWWRETSNRLRRRTSPRPNADPSECVAESDLLSDLRPLDPWFHSHYVEAVDVIGSFLAGDGLSLAGATVADIGCGDGFTDLGVVERLSPAHLVGFDICTVDRDHLARTAERLLGRTALPEQLEFRTCGPDTLPADDASFDWVITWSAFEHVGDPLAVCREIRRVLKPDGKLFLQLYPFYHSPWGSHLEDWFPAPFVQHRLTRDAIRSHLLANPIEGKSGWEHSMFEAFDTLNRITIDGLQAALRDAGFQINKAELYTSTTHLPPESQHVDLSALLISGVILIAQPD